MSRPPLTGLASMTFQSSDVAKALDYYRDVHGWEERLLQTGAGGTLVSAFVRINDRQWVELRPETAPQTDRLIQFAFETADAEAMRKYLAASGWSVPLAVETNGLGNLSFVMNDPDGHAVEFVQLLPGGWPSQTKDRPPEQRALSTCMMHLGFSVYSLEKSLAFYRDLLGCREFWRGSSDERTLAWVQMKLPDDENYIELMLYDGEPTLEWLGVLNHFGLEVVDMAKTMEEASRRMGTKPFPREVGYSIGKCRHRLANVYDPDGTRAEFMERKTFDGSVTPSSPLPAPH